VSLYNTVAHNIVITSYPNHATDVSPLSRRR